MRMLNAISGSLAVDVERLRPRVIVYDLDLGVNCLRISGGSVP